MNDKRRPRGYRPSSRVKQTLDDWRRPAPVRTLIDGLGFLGSVLAVTLGLAAALREGWPWVLLLWPVAAVLVARQLRAVELIVHDASHTNLFPDHPMLNDALADVLFAAPVAQRTRAYWRKHRVHHSDFGSSRDPCLARMTHLNGTPAGVTRLVRYMRDYWTTVGQDAASLAAFVAWHGVVGGLTGLAAGALFGIAPATWLAAWMLGWIVPFLLTLPMLRMVAEREEHDYAGRSEFSSTVSNLGLWHRALFHPWHDGHHLLHHLFPRVPQTRHSDMHRSLDRIDPAYRKSLRRTEPLGPVANLTAVNEEDARNDRYQGPRATPGDAPDAGTGTAAA